MAYKGHQLEKHENLPAIRSAQLEELEHKRGTVEYHLEHGMPSLSRKNIDVPAKDWALPKGG